MARYYIEVGLVSGKIKFSRADEYTEEEVAETMEILKSIKSLTYLAVDQNSDTPLIVNPDNVEYLEMKRELPF